MRRLLLLVAAVCVFAALAAVAAKGATLSVTLDTPAVTAVGETVTVTEAPTGTEVTEVDVNSAEVVATPEPTSSFLCWNREMTNPVVYEDPVADTMWATGSYFEPQAILGTVEGG